MDKAMGKVTPIEGTKRGKCPKRYTTVWRNKWLTGEARSIEGIVSLLRQAAETLSAMAKAGVVVDTSLSKWEDDYVTLTTSDATVARKFGFEGEVEER